MASWQSLASIGQGLKVLAAAFMNYGLMPPVAGNLTYFFHDIRVNRGCVGGHLIVKT
jgi:hypothetical protein